MAPPVSAPDAGASPDHIEIDDLNFLITAHFSKVGSDLVLSDGHGTKLVLTSYFCWSKRPDLVSHGALIPADLVSRLAGASPPVQFAQAGAPAGALVIGHCDRVVGRATVQHENGVVDEMHPGDVLLKGDVVQTSDGASLTFSLIDGTAFNMGADARMVLSELVYDSNSTSNSASISLLKGAFTFVAGQVAHTGDMKIDTPVATMGIRGTTVNAFIDADVTGNVYSFTASLMPDPGGGNGQFDVLDRVTGAVLYHVSSTATSVTFTPAANFQVSVQESPKSPAEVQQELAVAQILFPVYLSNPANAPAPGAPQQPPQQQQQQQTQPPNNSLSTPDQQPQPNQEVQPDPASPTASASGGGSATIITSAVFGNNQLTNAQQQQTTLVILPVQTTTGSQTASLNSTGSQTASQGQTSSDATEVVPAVTINPDDGAGNNIINHTVAQSEITLSGSVAGLAPGANFTLTVQDGSFTKSYTATVNGAGTGWTATIPNTDAMGVADGTLTVTAQVTNQLGSAVAGQMFIVAETLPTVTINAIEASSGNVITHANAAAGIALSGTVTGLAPGVTFSVTLTDGSFSNAYTATVDATGTTWIATIPAGDALQLPNGIATVTAKVVDPFGNASSLASQTFTVAETSVTINTTDGDGDSVITHAEAQNGVTFSGTVSGFAAGDVLTVTLTDGSFTKSYTATVNEAGTGWTATIPSADATALANGTLTVAAKVTDASGAVLATALSQTFTVAETSVTINTTDGDGDSVITHAEAQNGVTFSGTVSGFAAGDVLTVTLTDGSFTKSYTATVNEAGTGWTATIPSADATALANGTLTVAAKVTDASGAVLATAPSQTFTVAETSVTINTTDGDGDSVITHAEAQNGVTFSGTVSGFAAGDVLTVTLTDGSFTKSYTATVNEAGTGWTATIPSADATALANGTLTVAAKVTDASGAVLATAPSQTFTVAETSVTINTTDGDGDSVITHAEAQNGVTFSGTVSGFAAGDVLTVTLTDGSFTKSYTATVNEAGTGWTATIPSADATALANGTLTVAAKVTDASGAVLATAPSQTFTVAETSVTINTTDGDGDSVITHAEAQNGVTFSGTVSGFAAGDVLTVTLTDGSFTKSYTATVNEAGTGWTATIPSADATALANGTLTVAAKVTDASGAVLATAPSQTFTVAETSVTINTTDGDGDSVITHAEAQNGVTFSGTVSGFAAGDVLTVTLTDGSFTKSYTATVNEAGTGWTATIPSADATALANGTLTVAAKVTDASGAVLATAPSQTFTVAETSVTINTTDGDGDSVITHAEAQNGVTFSGTVSGFAAGDVLTVTLTDGSFTKSYTATVNEAGTGWTATIPSADATALANGTLTVAAKVTDASGAVLATAPSQTFTVAETSVTINTTDGDGDSVITHAEAQNGVTFSGTVSGFAAGDVLTVTLTDGSFTKSYTATVNEAGTGWTATIPSADATALANGTLTVAAKVTDASGAVLATAPSQTFTVAETSVTINTTDGDGDSVITHAEAQNGVTFSGTVSGFAAGDVLTVTLTDGSFTKSYTATVNEAGTGWTATIPSADATALANGTLTVAAKVTDASGAVLATAPSQTFTVAETSVTINTTDGDGDSVITHAEAQNGVTFSGTVSGFAAGDVLTVTLTDGSFTKSYTATVNEAGTGWTATIPSADATALANGTLTVAAKVTDASGAVLATAPSQTFTVAETSVTINTTDGDGDSVITHAEAQNGVTFSGTVSGFAAGDVLTVTLTDGSFTKSYTATVNEAGTGWTATIPSADATALANGTLTVAAKVTDASGAVLATAPSQTFTVAETSVTINTTDGDGDSVITHAEAQNGVTFSGTVSGFAAGDVLTVTLTDGSFTKSYTATVNEAGTGWTATIPSADATALANGTLTVAAKVTDASGAVLATAPSQTFTVAETSVTINTTDGDGDSVITHAEAQNGVTFSGTVSGFAAGDVLTVTLTDGSFTKSYTATVNEAGTGWTATIPSADATALANGTLTVAAKVTDASGAVLATAPSQTFTVAETSVTINTTDGDGDSVITHAEAQNGVTFSGTVSGFAAGDVLTVTLTDGSFTKSYTATVNEAGTGWTATIPSADATALANGTLTVAAKVTDASGAVLATAPSQTFTVAETSVTINTTDGDGDSVITHAEAQNGVTFSGTVSGFAAGDVLTVTLTDGSFTKSYTATVNEAGTGWTATIPSADATALANGTLTVAAKVTDASGAVLATAPSQTFTVAETSVTINTTDGDGDSVITHAEAQNGVTFSGTVSGFAAGDVLTVTLTDGSFTKSYTATVNEAGTGWTATIPSADATALANGTLTVAAKVTDASGAVLATAPSQTFTVAETSVTINTTDGDGDSVITHAEAQNGVTFSGTVSGFAAGDVLTVTLTDGSFTKSYTATVNEAGTGWTATIPSADATALANGTLTVAAKVTDASGAVLATAPSQTFTVAETSVTINTTDGDGDSVITHAEAQNGVTFSGTVSGFAAGDVLTVTLTDGSFTKSYTATVNEAGTGWTATIPSADATALANGTLTVAAKVTDASGAVLATAPSQTFTVAETSVTINTTDGDGDSVITHAEAQNGVTFSGTVSGFAAGDVLTVTLTDGSFTKSYTATVNEAGTGWTATIPSADATALANGTLTVAAKVTDASGAVLATAPSQTFTVAETSEDHWNGGNGDWNAANWTNGIPTSNTDAFVDAYGTYTVNISQAEANTLTINDAGATVKDNGSLQLSGALTLTAGTFQLDNGSLEASLISIGLAGIFLVGQGTHVLSEPITNNGSFIVDGNNTIADITGTLSGSGSYTINSGSVLQFGGSSYTITGSITDNGTVEVTSGKLELAGSVAGNGEEHQSGILKIDTGATLQLDGVDSVNVQFANSTGELILKDPGQFTGTIAGLTGSDQIDLTNISWNSEAHPTVTPSYDKSANITTLTIMDSQGHIDTIKLVGNYMGSSWTVSSDGNGGTLLVDPPASADAAVGSAVGVAVNSTSSNNQPVDNQSGDSTGAATDATQSYINEFLAEHDHFVFAKEANHLGLASPLGTSVSPPQCDSEVNAAISQQSHSFDLQYIGTPTNEVTDIHKGDLTSHLLDQLLGSNSQQAQQFAEIFAETKAHHVVAQPGSVISDTHEAHASTFFAYFYGHF